MGYEYGIFHKRKIYEKQLYLFHLYRLGVNLGLVSLKFFFSFDPFICKICNKNSHKQSIQYFIN